MEDNEYNHLDDNSPLDSSQFEQSFDAITSKPTVLLISPGFSQQFVDISEWNRDDITIVGTNAGALPVDRGYDSDYWVSVAARGIVEPYHERIKAPMIFIGPPKTVAKMQLNDMDRIRVESRFIPTTMLWSNKTSNSGLHAWYLCYYLVHYCGVKRIVYYGFDGGYLSVGQDEATVAKYSPSVEHVEKNRRYIWDKKRRYNTLHRCERGTRVDDSVTEMHQTMRKLVRASPIFAATLESRSMFSFEADKYDETMLKRLNYDPDPR